MLPSLSRVPPTCRELPLAAPLPWTPDTTPPRDLEATTCCTAIFNNQNSSWEIVPKFIMLT